MLLLIAAFYYVGNKPFRITVNMIFKWLFFGLILTGLAASIDPKLGAGVGIVTFCGFLYSLIKALRAYYISIRQVVNTGVDEYTKERLKGKKHEDAALDASFKAGIKLFEGFDKAAFTSASSSQKSLARGSKISNIDPYGNESNCLDFLTSIKSEGGLVLEKFILKDLPTKDYGLLHYAVKKSWLEVIEFILKQNVDYYVTQKEKQKIIEVAKKGDNANILTTLLNSNSFKV